MKKIFTFIAAAFLLAGCSDNAPSCSSSDVEGLVLEISIEEIQKQLFNRFGGGATVIYDRVKNKNYDGLKDEEKQTFIDLRKQYDSMNDLSLDSIRTSEVDEKLLKSTCEGKLNLNGASFDITFDAQTTDNGDLYVNVYGL